MMNYWWCWGQNISGKLSRYQGWSWPGSLHCQFISNHDCDHIQLSAVIKWFNMLRRYYINDYRNWSRISIRCWIHKRHPISRPNRRAMGCLLWIFVRKLTALYQHCIVYDKKILDFHEEEFQLRAPSQWWEMTKMSTYFYAFKNEFSRGADTSYKWKSTPANFFIFFITMS